MKKRFAFTLSETLIMVAIVGIIAAISVVSLKNLRPDKDALLIRKAYNEISKAVEAMVNDEILYPSQVAGILNTKNLLASTMQSVSLEKVVGDMYALDAGIQTKLDNIDSSNNIDTSNTSNILTSYNPNASNTSNTSVTPTLSSVTIDPNTMPMALEEPKLTSLTPPSSSSTSSGGSSSLNSNSSGTAPDPTGGNNSQGSYTLNNGVTAASKSAVFTNRTLPSGASGYTADTKFAYNFALQFEKINNDIQTNGKTCSFTTKDYMYWEVTDNFGNASDPHAIVMVDINGTSKGANSSNPDGSKLPDRFSFKIGPAGSISIYGTDKAATKALNVLKK